MKKITIYFLFLLSTIPVTAESYVFGGMGMQLDLGQLGATIVTDGLDSSDGGKAIVAENKLKTAAAATGNTMMNVPVASSAMLGGVFNIGYEKDIGERFFARTSVNYTDKIAGGHTIAKAGIYDWYNVRWNFQSWVIPVHFGIKIKTSDKSSVYIGGGMNYYQGGFGIKGRVDGATLASAGGIARKVTDALGVSNTQIFDEDIQFRVKGTGLNWIIGASTPVSEKGSVFFEVETILSGQMGKGISKSEGGRKAIAYEAYYPVIIGGTIYRFGFKHEI